MDKAFPAMPSEADDNVRRFYKHMEDVYWPKFTDEEQSQFRNHLEYIKFTPSTASYCKHLIGKRCDKGSDEVFYIFANAIWGKSSMKKKSWYEARRELLDRFPSKACDLALRPVSKESKPPSEMVETPKQSADAAKNKDKGAPAKSAKAKKNKPKSHKASQAGPTTPTSATGQSLNVSKIEEYIAEIKRQHDFHRQDHEFMIEGLQEMFENTIHRFNSDLAQSEENFSKVVGVLEESVSMVKKETAESFSRLQKSFLPSAPATRNGSEVGEEKTSLKRKGEELTKELIKSEPRSFEVDLTEETRDDEVVAFLAE